MSVPSLSQNSAAISLPNLADRTSLCGKVAMDLKFFSEIVAKIWIIIFEFVHKLVNTFNIRNVGYLLHLEFRPTDAKIDFSFLD